MKFFVFDFKVARLAAAAVFAAALGLGSETAVAGAATCAANRSKTVLSSATVRVYSRGNHATRRYYGCLRRSGRTRFLDAAEDDSSDSGRLVDVTKTFQLAALRGPWVAWTAVDSNIPEESMSSGIHLIDLESGRRTFVSVSAHAGDVPDAIVLNSAGALAWLTSDESQAFLLGGAIYDAATATFGRSIDIAVGTESGVSILRLSADHRMVQGQFLLADEDTGQPYLADVNGDGLPDLIVKDSILSKMDVFPGRADGTFGPLVSSSIGLTVPGGVDDYSGVDLNHDGHADAILAGEFGGIEAMLGTSTGHLTAEPVVSHTDVLDGVGDATGDGIPDLIVDEGSAGAAPSLLAGKGDGTFMPAVALAPSLPAGTGFGAATIADLNRDGTPDLVFVAYTAGIARLAVMLGLGHGRFAPATLTALPPQPNGEAPTAPSVGDVSGDGVPDIVVGNDAGVLIFDGVGNGTFGPPTAYKTGPAASVVLADLNHDGRPDIVQTSGEDQLVTVLLNIGDGKFAGPQPIDDLYVRDTKGHRKLAAAGTIPTGSVRFTGSTLRWLSGGTERQTSVR